MTWSDNASRSRRAKEMRVIIEARNAFDRLIQRDPDHLDHYYDSAQMLAAMGNHAEALAKLNTALAYCPFEPEWNLEAAASYLALEDFERAQAFIAVVAESSRALTKPH